MISDVYGNIVINEEIGPEDGTKGDWSSGMIPVLGTGGPGFNSRIAPFYFISISLLSIYYHNLKD